MTNSKSHSPSKDKTRADFSGASKDPNADIHDESPEEFEKKFGETLNKFAPEPDPDDQTAEAERARKSNQKARDDLNNKYREDAAEDEKGKAGFDKGEKVDFEADGAKYTGSRFKDRLMYGIADKGAYYKYANSKQVSDKQLRRMIIRAHMDKGWTEMRFHKRNGDIDQKLTSRAQAMITTEFASSKIPVLKSIAANVKVSSTPSREVEPWQVLNPLAHIGKFTGNLKNDFKSAVSTAINDRRSRGLISDGDKPKIPLPGQSH